MLNLQCALFALVNLEIKNLNGSNVLSNTNTNTVIIYTEAAPSIKTRTTTTTPNGTHITLRQISNNAWNVYAFTLNASIVIMCAEINRSICYIFVLWCLDSQLFFAHTQTHTHIKHKPITHSVSRFLVTSGIN